MSAKRVLFVCGSLEPGCDGVGDYTRELAGALLELEVESEIIAIMDRNVAGIVKHNQSSRGRKVSVTRLSKLLSFGNRKKEYQNLLARFKPDYISLQFVPYAFSPRGIPINLLNFLGVKGDSVKWHFMFHEGYIGSGLNFKEKIIRKIQINIIKSLVRRLAPVTIHTSIPLYQGYLSHIGIKSDILGLFGNIPISQNNLQENSNPIFRGVYFGAAPRLSDFQVFVDGLNEHIQKTQVKIQLVFCGRSGKSGKDFASFLQQNIPYQNFDIIEKGEMSSKDLSDLFLNSDFAIAREPPHLLGKSGSVITMLEHGIPMWVPLAHNLNQIAVDFDFRVNQCYTDLIELKRSQHSFERNSRLQEIADSFKKSLISK